MIIRPRCADERIWGGKPPEEYYIPVQDMTPEQKAKWEAWIKDIQSKWDEKRLDLYLMDNDLASQDLSDEELNNFRKDL